MEVPVRAFKSRLSEYLRRVAAGEDVVVTSHGKAIARVTATRTRADARTASAEEARSLLRAQPWIRAGKGKPRVPASVARLNKGEKPLAEIIIDERQ